MLARRRLAGRCTSWHMDHGQIRSVRARERSSSAHIAPPPLHQGGTEIERQCVERGVGIGRNRGFRSGQSEIGFGEMAFRAGGDARLQRREHMRAVDHHLRAMFGHTAFNSVEPSRIGPPLLEQSIALTHGFFIGGGCAPMPRDMRHDLPIEEPPPV